MKLVLNGLWIAVFATLAVAQQPPTPPQSKSISSYLGLHTFPAKNQTPAQQQEDEMGCYKWAKQDSSYDPLAAVIAQQEPTSPTPAPPTTPQTQGAGVKGAAKGAARGAVVGAIAGDAGKGAEAGAASGAIAGRSKARRAKKQAEKQTQQQQQQKAQAKAETQQKLDGFKKGFSACMEAKGYVVK